MGETEETIKNKSQTTTQTLRSLQMYLHKKLGQWAQMWKKNNSMSSTMDITHPYTAQTES